MTKQHAGWCNLVRPIPHGWLAERGACNCKANESDSPRTDAIMALARKWAAQFSDGGLDAASYNELSAAVELMEMELVEANDRAEDAEAATVRYALSALSAEETVATWVKENSPGGWIDDLRNENEILKDELQDARLRGEASK